VSHGRYIAFQMAEVAIPRRAAGRVSGAVRGFVSSFEICIIFRIGWVISIGKTFGTLWTALVNGWTINFCESMAQQEWAPSFANRSKGCGLYWTLGVHERCDMCFSVLTKREGRAAQVSYANDPEVRQRMELRKVFLLGEDPIGKT
jgi:hypothetical protein